LRACGMKWSKTCSNKPPFLGRAFVKAGEDSPTGVMAIGNTASMNVGVKLGPYFCGSNLYKM